MAFHLSRLSLGLALLMLFAFHLTLCSSLKWKKKNIFHQETKLRGKGKIRGSKGRRKRKSKEKSKGHVRKGKGHVKKGKSSKSNQELEGILLVELTGSPIEITEQEFRTLEHGFIELYNGLVDTSCRAIEDVTIELDVDPGLVESTSRMLQRRGTFQYRVTGRCGRSCGRRARVFNDRSRRRELGLSSTDDQMTRKTRGSWNGNQSNWIPQRYPRTQETHKKPFMTFKKQTKRIRGKGKGFSKSGKTNSKSTKRSKGGKGKRRKPDCPAPSLSEFIELYNELVQSLRDRGVLVNVDSVDGITELEEVECDAEVTPFETDVFVEHFGDPDTLTVAEIEALEEAFVDTYNDLNARNAALCDLDFRVVDEVQITVEEVRNRRLQGGRRRFTYRYQSRGRSRGRRKGLFDDASRRNLWSAPFDGRHPWATMDAATDSDTCFCPADVELRAPTEEEFQVAFDEFIQYLREIGIITSVDSIESVESSPEPDTTPAPTPEPDATPAPTPGSNSSMTILQVSKVGPGAAFTNQDVEFTINVTNIGSTTATSVIIEDKLPDEGTFVSSEPVGSVSGTTLTISLNDLAAGSVISVKVVWKAPTNEGTFTNQVKAKANNAANVFDDAEVAVGTRTTVTGGVITAGTGLRNRAGGTIVISGIPDGATVTRAVLMWAILFASPTPSNQITFQGTTVTADLTTTISTSLCWGDSQTIGYAADVTGLVTGNGAYAITDAVNGLIRADQNPLGVLPYTDGASLFVFYGGPGINNQVISDFTYSAINTTDARITRTLTGINSVDGTATLHLAGPDGQEGADEQIRISATGSGTLSFDNSWDGSAPQDGPDFSIGNLWDNDIHDVNSILPVSQDTLNIVFGPSFDCIGLSGVALEVQQ